MYQAILFDLDDTLYDLRSYWHGRLGRALDVVGVQHPEFDRSALVRSAMEEHIYIEHLPEFLRRRGVADEALIAQSHDIFRQGWFDQLVLYDDAIQTLETLREQFRLGLITNGPSAIQRPKIERFELVKYFDVLIVSGEVDVAKPDPAIFALALGRLGVEPHQALFVGDSPEHDLRGAEAAGVDFVWMNAHGQELPEGFKEPMAVIERLSDVIAIAQR
ncbi:MAG TPA: HAD family hydrolase [Roseiflexaceae bacterium]|nr:HAD family hydrolase [Roseiflexaceae bacterium]